MAVEVATAYVSLIPSAKGFGAKAEREIQRELGGAAGRAGKQFGDKFENGAARSFERFGKRASLAVSAPIGAAVAFSVKAASDLSEAVNKVDVVFAGSAASIHEFADSAARDLGISRRAAEEAAGTFGNLFVSMGLGAPKAAEMSTAMVKLASDLASFNNASPEEALAALRSGLLGETEPLKRFGVNLNDATLRQKALALGLTETTTSVLPPAIKAQAAYAVVLDQTKTAQGDFARTAGGAANQQRILKAQLEDTAAEIGTKLLPAATRLIGVVNEAVDAFSELPAPVQDAALATLAVVAAAGPAALAISKAASAVRGLGAAYQYATLSASSLALASTGVGLGVLGVLALGKGISEARKMFKDMNDAMDRDMAKAVNNFTVLGNASKEMRAEFFDTTVGLERSMGSAVKADFVKEVVKQGKEAKVVLDDLAGSTTISKERIVQLANSMGINLARATAEQRESLSQSIVQLERGITPTARLAEAQKVLGNEAATSAERFDAFKDALDAALGSHVSAERAALNYADKIAALGAAIAENGTVTGIGTEKQRALSKALLDVVDSAGSEVEALVEAGTISSDAAAQKAALLGRLVALKQQFPALAGKIDEYIGHVKSIPDSANTTVSLTGAEAAISTLQRLRNAMDLVRGQFGLSVTASGGKKPEGRALGGPVHPGNIYEVTEGGIPELLRQGSRTYLLPGSYGTVIPTAPASPAGPGGVGGGEYHFHFPNYLGSKDELIRVVSKGLYDLRMAHG